MIIATIIKKKYPLFDLKIIINDNMISQYNCFGSGYNRAISGLLLLNGYNDIKLSDIQITIK